MLENRIICHGNCITIVLQNQEAANKQEQIAAQIADLLKSSSKIENFNHESDY